MHNRFRSVSAVRFGLLLAAAAILPMGFSGCGLLAGGGKQGAVPADYHGLDNQSVAIIVYTAQANTDEFPGAREDISSFVANQFRLHMPTTRLLNYKEVINWQDDTRNWFALDVKDMGKHFSVDRVLYIEVLTYEARADSSYGDLQGHIRANCKVFDVNSQEDAPVWTGVIDALWPEDRPASANQTNEITVRTRALHNFAEQLVGHFYDSRGSDVPLKDR